MMQLAFTDIFEFQACFEKCSVLQTYTNKHRMSLIFLQTWKNSGSFKTFHSLQGETVTYTDKYGLVAGGAAAAAALLQKQMKYRQSHGIGLFITSPKN